MATNINTFKEFVFFVSNKTQSGNSVTIPQFNTVANQAQCQVFEKDYNTFVQTGDVSEFLKTFLKNKILSINSYGEADFPDDFEHVSSMRRYYVLDGVGKEVPVDEVKNSDWGAISISQLNQPTLRFPKYTEFSGVFKFLPKNTGIVFLDYFKTPTPPIWGYTTVNGRPVYNPATSTDFEWDSFALNNVASMYLSLIGINLRQEDLAQFSEMYKQQTNSIL